MNNCINIITFDLSNVLMIIDMATFDLNNDFYLTQQQPQNNQSSLIHCRSSKTFNNFIIKRSYSIAVITFIVYSVSAHKLFRILSILSSNDCACHITSGFAILNFFNKYSCH